jgi:hypothetical protein
MLDLDRELAKARTMTNDGEHIQFIRISELAISHLISLK